MRTYKVTPHTIQSALRNLGTNLQKEAIQGMRAAAARTLRHIVTKTIPTSRMHGKLRPPIGATGLYRAGWKVGFTARGATVSNDTAYAGVVELGRRPGKFPPRKPIELWIRRVLGKDETEAKRLVFPISAAIKRKGIPGRQVIGRAIPAARRFAAEEVQKSFARTEATYRP